MNKEKKKLPGVQRKIESKESSESISPDVSIESPFRKDERDWHLKRGVFHDFYKTKFCPFVEKVEPFIK